MSTNTGHQDNYSLGYHLHLAFIAVVETLNQELRRAGLKISHPQFAILQTVFRRPGLSQAELARETAKDVAAITRSLSYLEKLGLGERKWLNGCTKGVYPTPQAESLRPLLDEAIRKTIDRACAVLDAEEAGNLIRYLREIKTTLSKDE